MFSNNSILRSWFLQLTVTVILITSMNVSALPPSWWQQPDSAGRRVVYPSVINSNNFAPANIGQAKFMAKRAIETLRMYAPAVANDIEAELVGPGNIIPSWNVPAPGSELAKQQYAPLQIGQLKAIADPFYARLNAHNSAWLNGQLLANATKDTADSTNFFPWTTAPGDDKNKAIASIGQLKAVFSLHFDDLEVTDPDENTGTMARLSVVGNMKVRVTESNGTPKNGVKLQFTRLKGNGSFAGGAVQKTYTTNTAGEVALSPTDYTSPEDDVIRVSMLTQEGRQNVWLPANVSSPEPVVRTGSGGYDYQAPGRLVSDGVEPEVDDNPDPPGSAQPVKRFASYIKYDATWEETIGGLNAKVTTKDIDWNPVLGAANGIVGVDDYASPIQFIQVPGRVVTTTIDYEAEGIATSVVGPTVIPDVMSVYGEGYEIYGYTEISDNVSLKGVATMNISAANLPVGVGRIEMEHAYAWRDAVGNTGISGRRKLVLGSAKQEIITSTDKVNMGNGCVASVIGPFISRGIAEPGRSFALEWSEIENNEVRFDVEDMQSLRVEVIADDTACSSALPTYGWKVESSNPEIDVCVRSHNGAAWVGHAVPVFFYDDLVGPDARTTAEILIKCAEGAVNSSGMITISFVNAALKTIVEKEFKVVVTGNPSSNDDSPSFNEGNLTKTLTNNESSGPKYRKIALDGRPLADEKPQSAAETDEEDEQTYVDALTRELRHSTTDIYVPVPGSDLALTVRRNIVSEIWNPTSGLCPHEDPTLAFGPVWRTNLAAHVNIIEQYDRNGEMPEGDQTATSGIGSLVAGMNNDERAGASTTQRDPNYAFVTDEDGASHRFMIAYGSEDGRDFVPAPTDKNDRAANEVSLKFGGTGLIFSKLHGNTLEYEQCIDF